jgi:hypothetical protein
MVTSDLMIQYVPLIAASDPTPLPQKQQQPAEGATELELKMQAVLELHGLASSSSRSRETRDLYRRRAARRILSVRRA